MPAQEGVIKFELVQENFHRLHFSPEIKSSLAELNQWRRQLVNIEGIGCDLSRYGACYGNVSQRYILPDSLEYSYAKPRGRRAFLISGTQTGKFYWWDLAMAAEWPW